MSELFETIRQIDAKTGITVKDWHCSIREIARQLDIPVSNVSSVINGKRKSACGFIFQKISVISVTPSVISVTPSVITSDDELNTIETRSLPVRKIPLSINDIDEDSSEDRVRTTDNIALLSERENEYIDWVWDCLQNISSIQKLRCPETGKLYSVYYNRSELEGEIASHLKGGYHYDVEPAKTIKRACELVLFDLFLDDLVKEFKETFSTESVKSETIDINNKGE